MLDGVILKTQSIKILVLITITSIFTSCNQQAQIDLNPEELARLKEGKNGYSENFNYVKTKSNTETLLIQASEQLINQINQIELPQDMGQFLGESQDISSAVKSAEFATALEAENAKFVNIEQNKHTVASIETQYIKEDIQYFIQELNFEKLDSSKNVAIFRVNMDCDFFDFACKSFENSFSIEINTKDESLSINWMRFEICKIARKNKNNFSLNCNISSKLLHSFVKNTLMESDDEYNQNIGQTILATKFDNIMLSVEVVDKSIYVKSHIGKLEHSSSNISKGYLGDLSIYAEAANHQNLTIKASLGGLKANMNFQDWQQIDESNGEYIDRSIATYLDGVEIDLSTKNLQFDSMSVGIKEFSVIDNLAKDENENTIIKASIPKLEYIRSQDDADLVKVFYSGKIYSIVKPYTHRIGQAGEGWISFNNKEEDTDKQYVSFSLKELREDGFIAINESDFDLNAGLIIDEEEIFDRTFDINKKIDARFVYQSILQILGIESFDDLTERDSKEDQKEYLAEDELKQRLYFSNLSLMSNLSGSDLNNFNFGDNWNLALPKIDVTAWDTTGLDLSYLDMSNALNFTSNQLNQVANLYGAILPAMDVSGWATSGIEISYMDLSRVTGLIAAQINNSSSSWGVKLPAGMNVTELSADRLQGLDLSETIGLTIAQLNAATNLNGTVLPAIVLEDWITSGKYIDGMDLSQVTGLTAAHINNSSSSWGVKLPAGMNVTELSADRLQGLDLSKTTGLTVDQLNAATNLNGTILPSMDVKEWNTSGKYIEGMDLSRVEGLTAAHINNSSSSWGVKLPAGMNVTELSADRLQGLDLSKTTGLTVDQLNAATNLHNTILPAINVTGWETKREILGDDNETVELIRTDISSMDLSRVDGLTADMLNDAERFYGVILPAIDIAEIDLTRPEGLQGMDLSRTTGLSADMLNQVTAEYGFAGVKFPSMNVTGWNTQTKYLIKGCDLSLVIGLTAQMLNSAEEIYHMTLPDGMDMTWLDLAGKYVGDVDFSQSNNLSLDAFKFAKEVRNITLPYYLLNEK
jgi:hypothetical protein